ncbi:MAG: hypothetical protein ACSHYB_05405 [Roseibacillus sp.]
MVSDWHLGHPGSQVNSIARVEHLLEGVGTLVMVGDGREELVEGWRNAANRLWKDLEEACERRGILFVALTGNHDPNVSGEGWLKLAGGHILVTHGDMIYDTMSPWSRELFAKREEVHELLKKRESDSLDTRWECAREVGRLLRPSGKAPDGIVDYLKIALWPPERLTEVVRVWGGFFKEGERFLHRFAPESKILVCGHFHRRGKFVVGERTVWNTGSLMKVSKGLALDFDGESLSAQEIQLGPLVGG